MTTLVIGLDGTGSGERALEHGKHLASLIGDCDLVVAYVIEWSPFAFQTQEENAKRHMRREEEISSAQDRLIAPAVKALSDNGFKARGVVRHGDVAETLDAIAKDENAAQIIVTRSSEGGISTRIFGTSTANLVMSASVPVTVVA
ncbi:MAG: universal stress protein [Halocynthiibacter sp.]